MKKIVAWLVCSLLALTLIAQTGGSAVTINVMGNRNKQIRLDGTVYAAATATTTTSSTTTPNTAKSIIMIPQLAAGQHTLEVVNENPSAPDEDNSISTIFKTRIGYDLQITVRNNGSVQLKETKAKAIIAGHPGINKTPMSATAYNTLLQNVRRQVSANTKLSLIRNAINDGNNYFTTSQAELLLAQINTQPNRVSVLKSIYLKVTDPENFSELYNQLLTTQAARDQLAAHVNTYNYNGGGSTLNQGKYAMSDASFNNILQTAKNQWSSSAKVNYLVSTLGDANNYFTTYQARQLIQVVPEENNRLLLAKTVYRGITDAGSFSQLNDLFSSVANRNELAAYISSYNGVAIVNKTPVTDGTFETLYLDVQRKLGQVAKVNGVTTIFTNTSYYFTTSQAKQLIELVNGESNRLQLAKASYRSITDPANFSQINDLLSSTQARNELAVYVNSYNTTGATVVPKTIIAMPAASYNSLFRTVQTTWGLGAKMSSLTEIFSNPANYFTTEQARKLIELVSSETNRLTLAKLAHKQIVDLENFTQLATILSSQASKDELEVYARQ